MNERALKQLFDDFGRSLERLAEALSVRADEPLAIDGTIQRFEFTFEPFWKAVRRPWPGRASRPTARRRFSSRPTGSAGSMTSRGGGSSSKTAT
jgi:hypothetical protein